MQNNRERAADRLSGVGWIVFGVVIVGHALTMETRDYLGATFLTGPGLVPAMIGAAIAALGLVLLLRSSGGEAATDFEEGGLGGRRVAAALALMLIYGLGLIGRIDFELATFLFVTAFVVVFNLPAGSGKRLAVLVAKAAATGLATALVVSFVFETIFLVRLP